MISLYSISNISLSVFLPQSFSFLFSNFLWSLFSWASWKCGLCFLTTHDSLGPSQLAFCLHLYTGTALTNAASGFWATIPTCSFESSSYCTSLLHPVNLTIHFYDSTFSTPLGCFLLPFWLFLHYFIPDSLCLLIPYSSIAPSPYTVFLMIAILVVIKWYQNVVLIYISLMTNDTEHLFMWLLTTYISL